MIDKDRSEAVALLTGGHMSIFLHILMILAVGLCAHALSFSHKTTRFSEIRANYTFVGFAAGIAYVFGALLG